MPTDRNACGDRGRSKHYDARIDVDVDADRRCGMNRRYKARPSHTLDPLYGGTSPARIAKRHHDLDIRIVA
jgi:hypothetical protein